VTYDLSAFGAVGGPATRWATDTGGGGDRYAKYDATAALSGRAATLRLPANCVQTLEVHGVRR
jgi:hypothetical protein